MKRIVTFWMAPLCLAAAIQLYSQIQTGVGIEPQRQALATLAAEISRAINR
jgi:hypothetical protein